MGGIRQEGACPSAAALADLHPCLQRLAGAAALRVHLRERRQEVEAPVEWVEALELLECRLHAGEGPIEVTRGRVAERLPQRLGGGQQCGVPMLQRLIRKPIRLLEPSDRRGAERNVDGGRGREHARGLSLGLVPADRELRNLVEPTCGEEGIGEHEAREPLGWRIRPVTEAGDRLPQDLRRAGVVAGSPLELTLERADARQLAGLTRQLGQPPPQQRGRGPDESRPLPLDRRDGLRPVLRFEPVLRRLDRIPGLGDRRGHRCVQPPPLLGSELRVEPLQQELAEQRVIGESLVVAGVAHEHSRPLDPVAEAFRKLERSGNLRRHNLCDARPDHRVPELGLERVEQLLGEERAHLGR